jgi:LysM repeat protein
MERVAIVAIAGLACCAAATPISAQTLRGSPQAMQQQNRVAHEHDYTFLQTGAQVRQFVESGYLVRLPGNGDYELASVSYPFARPAVKLFVERLAAQYRSACGEKLVITSLTRPVREQPRNASALSVHPAGMAVDLRVSGRSACRTWLERTLLSLERQGVLNAIRENRPPHYHIALYPNQYTQYVARMTNGAATARLASAQAPPAAGDAGARGGENARENAGAAGAGGAVTVADAQQGARTDVTALAAALSDTPEAVRDYRVNRGDSLWSIARRHGTTVDTLKALNGLNSSSIVAGQVIAIPAPALGAEASP